LPKNLFSIVIPTRQRHDTLRYSIQSVLNQTYKNFELVVMDNFSSKETYELVSSFDDPRIKYYRSPERLRMTDNWELGLSHASGEYITFIGDDDALLPDALDRCHILLNQYNVKILTWYRWPYFWPNASAIQQRDQLFIPLEQGVAVWNSKEKLKLCYQYQITYEYLPMLYNSFISREIIEKVKSFCGTYFSSRAVSPDLCSGIVNAYFSDSYLFSSRYFSFSGISKHSIGMSSITLTSNSKDSTPADEFIKEHSAEITHKNLITSSHFRIIMASDLLFTKDAFFPEDSEIQLNVRGLLEIMAAGINNDPDDHSKSYENTLEDIKKLALKYGISLQELHIPPQIAVQKRTKVHHGPMRDSSGNISGLIVDCKKAGITDAAQAAMLAYSLMEGESVVAENDPVKIAGDIKLKESQKSKVLLISLPGLNNGCEPIFPLGIGYLLSSIRLDRLVQAVHYQAFEHATQQLPVIISTFQPEIVGLTCSTFNRGNVRTICAWLRKNHPHIKIILGGVHVSFLAEQALRDYGADCVVIGEGELTFRELCDALDKDITLAGVKGIAFLDDEKFVTTEPREVVRNLDYLPLPDYSYAGDLMRRSGMGFIITSRGCPVRCSFCSTSSYWGQKVRTNSPKRIVDEMEALVATYGVKKIFFHDDTFNLSMARTRDICAEITLRGINVEWGVSCRVNPVSQEMIDMMVAAGCRHICWGIESGSKTMLERIDKKITQEQISKAFEICRKHLGTISVGAFTMVGNPGESEATIAESIQFINTLHMTDQPSTSILYILPGTKLYAELLVKHPELECFWVHNNDILQYTLENTLDKLNKWAIRISQSGSIVFFDRNKHFWNNVLFGNIPQPTSPDLSFIASELDHVIPPEIKDDEFYFLIQKLAREEEIHTVLEIGSSAGGGSTEAFVTGLGYNRNHPRLYCMEISKPRFAELQKRYSDKVFVKCYNVSSLSISKFPSEMELSTFYKSTRTALNDYPLERVIGWLRQDIDYVQSSGVPADGIERIKRENGIKVFDMILIDGSEFTGKAELDELYGAKFILLDDINGFKNYNNHQRLLADPFYDLLHENWKVRNGYSIFRKNDTAMSIHFFTIVLNGEPFIKHHLEQFLKLTFRWHWHIIEGVAELKHDTAWSLQNGGKISDELHRNGLSNDGTTEYLDQIAQNYPDNITIYRKPGGQYWDGKLEMVNAPIVNIGEECLLWQVDADELWVSGQIEAMRKMFIGSPNKTAAYFHCDYFVGPRKYVSSLNTWATYPTDWLRVWRYRPGMSWSAHEPPILEDKEERNQALIAPFTRDETMIQGITFQHFAYATEAQVRFKEVYYGYANAVSHWNRLQETQGAVNPANYLPWAKNDATVDDWPATRGQLLSEYLIQQQTAPKNYVSMSVDGATQFETELRKLFNKYRPSSVIETGTYLGQGTSTIIWRALRDFRIDADFTTIEVNPEHHRQAVEHFRANGMHIRAELGLSVPRAMLPNQAEITDKFINNKEYTGIYYDHDESVRADLYFSETDYNVSDNLLFGAMERSSFKPDFVLLDSAGHMGFIEFQYVMSLIQGDCLLMLDDVYHCKHFKTLQVIKQDPRFEILVESHEKFGFCIARYNHVKSLLIIRNDSIGDNILASSMLEHIRKQYPRAIITVVCQQHIAELYEACPYINGIILLDKPRLGRDPLYREIIIKRLQAVNADLALNSVYSREPETDLLASQCGARIRIALDGDLCNLSPDQKQRGDKGYTKLICSNKEDLPELERHHEFLQGIGVNAPPLTPCVWTTQDDALFAESFFTSNNLKPESTIAIFPGAQWEIKLYDHFAETLAELCRQNGFTVIGFGISSEVDLTQQQLDALSCPTINLCGKVTLRQTAELLRRCRLAVGVDSALAHMSCAVGIPNVIVLGGGHFGRFMPYSPLTSVVCLPLECYGCNWKCRYDRPYCIQGIAPEIVQNAIKESLQNNSIKPRIHVQHGTAWDQLPGRPIYDITSLNFIKAPADVYLYDLNALKA